MSRLSGVVATLIGAAVVLASSAVASATSVDYTTSGLFGSNSLAAISGGGITVTFNPGGQTGVNTPSFISLGTFTVTGTSTASTTLSDTFTLTVNQTIPLPSGSASFGQGTVSGHITFNGSTGLVQFTSPLTVSIASVPVTTYSITSSDSGSPGSVALIAPNGNSGSGNGVSSIQGKVTAVPVPAAVWAGASMLGGLGALGLRRRVRS